MCFFRESAQTTSCNLNVIPGHPTTVLCSSSQPSTMVSALSGLGIGRPRGPTDLESLCHSTLDRLIQEVAFIWPSELYWRQARRGRMGSLFANDCNDYAIQLVFTGAVFPEGFDHWHERHGVCSCCGQVIVPDGILERPRTRME